MAFLAMQSLRLLLIVISCNLIGATAKNTLIVADRSSNIPIFMQSHSGLIKLIAGLGYNYTIRSADDSTLKLSKYGEFLYDNIILFCPQVEAFRGNTNVKEILAFIDSGRNILLAVDDSPSSFMSELASEVGFELKQTKNRDYGNTKLNDAFYLVGDKSKYTSASFSYSGSQLKMLKSELNLEILSNNAPVDDIRPTSAGKYATNVLIGAMQARNNARVVISGSLDFYSDKAFETSKSANKHLTNELLSWLFKEKSLLRYSQVKHRKLNVGPLSSTDIASKTDFQGYTIMDDIEYSIRIEICENGKWSPYGGEDVQFEFVRIDPFIRKTMQRQPDGSYLVRFKVPDVYGVYKFQIDYRKEGLTHLFSSTQVSVRPLRHNEYERFIYSACPYYLSAFLMMVYLHV